LQTNILPVGVTPVTAIPTRISHGPVAQAGVEFAEAQARIIDLSELAEYATEEKNPSNAKHVTRIVVKLPSSRLSEGVTFVDTPGLGSLAVAGAEETVAYLPRCDTCRREFRPHAGRFSCCPGALPSRRNRFRAHRQGRSIQRGGSRTDDRLC